MIQFNGHDYVSADEMPVSVRAAYDRAVAERPKLHSGARLAAKLNAKIIVNGAEFNHAGEMSVDDRRLYHEALEAVFPPGIVVRVSEPLENRTQKSAADHSRRQLSRGSWLSLAARLVR